VLPLLEHVLIRGALIAVRIGGIMTFAPFLGGTGIPARIKAFFTLLLTVLLYPVCTISNTAVTPLVWSKIALSEAVLGLAVGLCVQFIFEAAELAGQVAGFQLAFSLVNVIDPNTNVDTPVLSVFHQLFALLLFLQLNVHHWILRAAVKSFDYVPVGSVNISAAFLAEMLHAAGAMWFVGLQIATPILFATLLIDLTVAFLTKASPQLPAILFSIPMKSVVGYGVLAIGISLWPGIFEKQFTAALGWSERLLHLAH
jgi:flagellar biosynthetic protein FliR